MKAPVRTFNVTELKEGKVTLQEFSKGRWGLIRQLVRDRLGKKDDALLLGDLVNTLRERKEFKKDTPQLVYNMARNALLKFQGFRLERMHNRVFVIRVE